MHSSGMAVRKHTQDFCFVLTLPKAAARGSLAVFRSMWSTPGTWKLLLSICKFPKCNFIFFSGQKYQSKRCVGLE